ncbi:MAG: M48 family metallopeptidase [Candidatus Sericytochromatia bacterium]|nr:M48 family metallopeptidase [Candidatus Sericytochromatia bacterium]
MEIDVCYVSARTARAHMRQGVLHVKMPQHWPAGEQSRVIERFLQWARKRTDAWSDLPPPVQRPAFNEASLSRLVREINQRTLNVPLKGVRLGKARRTRLAQANVRTGILTFSRHAIDGLCDEALTYLVVHELAHLQVPDHSSAFWNLVAAHVPDWRHWRRVAQGHFERAMAGEDAPRPLAAPPFRPEEERVVPFPPPAPQTLEDIRPSGPLAWVPPLPMARGSSRQLTLFPVPDRTD